MAKKNLFARQKPGALPGGMGAKERHAYKTKKGGLKRKRIRRRSVPPKKQSHSGPFKPGRFADYYEHGSDARFPPLLVSIAEGRATGSTIGGGILGAWAKGKGIDFHTLDKKLPQIGLIPKEDITEILLNEFRHFRTPGQRAQFDARAAALGPELRGDLIISLRDALAGIDWAEQTHGIKIDVPKEILDWIGKVK